MLVNMVLLNLEVARRSLCTEAVLPTPRLNAAYGR